MNMAEFFNDQIDGNFVGPATDSPICELIFLCYNGNFQTIDLLIKSSQQLLLEKAYGVIGDCPKAEHKQTWVKLQEVLLRKHETYTVGDLLLCVACILQNNTLVELLTNRGVDVNHGATKHALLSPLYIACINQDMEMITYLMKNKAEVIALIAKEFPDLISQVLEKRIEEYRVPRKKKMMKNSRKKMIRLCWENAHLHTLNKDWFMVDKYEITRVELPRNKLVKLIDEFFEVLPHLEELDVASNHLMVLPTEHLSASKLKRLDASSNQLKFLPESLFFNPNIVVIDVSSNQLASLPETSKNWKCSSLEKFVCSKNQLTDLPKSITGASRLKILNLSRNRFEIFNRWWKCPIEELNLSFNQLKDCTFKTDSIWSKTLKTLILTRNNLEFIPSCVLHLAKLETMKIARNALKTLPRPDIWKTKRLLDLDLSYNQITTTPIVDGFLDLETEQLEYNNTCELPVKIFADTLQSLNLANNLLDEIPETLCELKALGRLDLSHNSGLTFLPPKLGLLKNIWSLNLSGLDIKNVPYKFEGLNHVKVLSFLRAKLRKSKPFNRIKLMLVGLQGRGKTTLVHAIQGKQPPPNISTVGIIVEQFVLPLRNQYYIYSSSPNTEIMFSVWDLAGQQVYYATHQCFLSGKTLYLVVYNVTHGTEGIDSLGAWLLNIQARAPNSRCIIVGTHVDKMPVYRKEETLIKYRRQIMDKFNKEGFPAISKCVFVSGTSKENIDELRNIIYKEAEEMNHQSELGKVAPISYLELYDQIMLESARRKEDHRPPVLTTDEMLQLAEQNPNNDIMDFEELCTASQFLHENGVLLHFNDHLRGLNNLFFIDPSWLIDIVALVVTVHQRNPYIQTGYITEQELLYILKNPWLPERVIPEYLRLLERFEILLSLEDGKFLIPCMLSEERPFIDDKMLHVITSEEIRDHRINVERTSNYLTRNYHMQYVPAGFWARLIARLAIAVQKWSVQIQQDGDIGYTKVLWREGLLVTYEDGYFLIESFHDEELFSKKWSNQGVSITVWSKTKDFSVMGFIVDHMEMLITEWYPGLEGINDYGDNLVQKLISCPVCCAQKAMDIVQCCEQNTNSLRNYYSSFFRNEFFVNQFPLDTCAYAAIDHQEIICVKHPDTPVPLDLLIPEIMMTDLPHKYRITEKSLEFDPDTSKRLGDGGAGVVYLGRYFNEDVAIKRSHSIIMKESHHKEGAFDPTDRSLTQLLSLDDGRVVKSFWEMRQEVLVLCTLHHPNIVKFLGVCFSPLCFVIEYAPMGSLYSILEKKEKKADLPVLGMRLTYLILFQIIEAIKYLHSWNIIYRDLKSDNVLVMSLNLEEIINVKLSDYGIAAFATPQGVTGVAGTPAFQAPEIQKDYTYDEKVDVFSYGIWMYELMTGCLPYLEYRSSSEIKKAIMTGVRPNFRKEGYRLSFPYAELLMTDCWQHDPPSRQSSYDISAFFKSTDMLTLQSLYPSNQDSLYLEHVTCHAIWNTNFPDTTQCEPRDKILLWNNKMENRTFVMFDLKCQTIRYHDSLPGPRVSCACQVEENVWLGCETNRVIEIFGFVNSEVPKILWTFSGFEDEVLMMLKNESEGILTVFATLANGTLVIFTKMAHHRKSDLIEEEDLWSRQVLNLQTCGRPAKCMTITNNRTELWVGSGNCILVLNIQRREIIDRINATKMGDQNSLISSICSDGVNTVWTSLWKSGFVTEWNVNERNKTFEYYCSENEPLHKGVRYASGTFNNFIRQPTVEERGLKEQSPTFQEMKTFGSPHSNRLAKDNLYKRPSLRFPTRTYVRHKSSTTSISSTLDEFATSSSNKRSNMFNKTVTSLRFVKNMLWIGRTNGDIIIIDYVTGHVISVLANDHLKLLGNDNRYIQSMVPMETSSKMTACVRIRNEMRGRRSLVPTLSLERKQKECYQILVYDVWSLDQFYKFNDKVQEIFNE